MLLTLATLVCATPIVENLALADQPAPFILPTSDDDFDEIASIATVSTDVAEMRVGRILADRRQPLRYDAQYFEGIIFGRTGPQSVEAARIKLGLIVQSKVAAIDLACGLTPGQKQTLRLAGAGDVKRLFDRVEEFKAKCLTQGPLPQETMRSAIDLRNMMSLGPFSDRSLFVKSLERMFAAGHEARRAGDAGIMERVAETVCVQTWPDAGNTVKEIRLTGAVFGDDALERFRRLTSLRTLTLEKTRVTSRGLAHLRVLAELEILSLCETQVADDGLLELAGMKNLRQLDLGATKITDAGLVHLAGMTNLQSVDLRRTSVSDAGLAHLAGLTNLKYVYLYGTPVTDAGIDNLQRSLPGAKLMR